ncbi:MAG: ANTAR domain-containing protein [Motiliproteus sp.]|nr:ANTAR domain-containing protein [Motiliproteus sp.]MCW9054044.1 ANTAR domain-containing protein [Motiliproteus sp.]
MNCATQISILVIDELPNRAESLCQQLQQEGFEKLTTMRVSQLADIQIDSIAPEVLIVSQDSADLGTVALVETLIQLSGSPTLVFTHQSSKPEIVQQLVEAGASCYQHIDPSEIPLKPIIDSSRDQFANLVRVQKELQLTKSQLADRKQIERAKGLLMKKHECDEEQAYIAMRKLAMNRAQRMGDVARELIQALNN